MSEYLVGWVWLGEDKASLVLLVVFGNLAVEAYQEMESVGRMEATYRLIM